MVIFKIHTEFKNFDLIFLVMKFIYYNSVSCQLWIFTGRTDAEAKGPILWPPNANSPLIGKKPWCWESLRAGGEEGNRGWDGWMASLIQWTWTLANFGRWWGTGKPGMLQSMRPQRVQHDLVTEQEQPIFLYFIFLCVCVCVSLCFCHSILWLILCVSLSSGRSQLPQVWGCILNGIIFPTPSIEPDTQQVPIKSYGAQWWLSESQDLTETKSDNFSLVL